MKTALPIVFRTIQIDEAVQVLDRMATATPETRVEAEFFANLVAEVAHQRECITALQARGTQLVEENRTLRDPFRAGPSDRLGRLRQLLRDYLGNGWRRVEDDANDPTDGERWIYVDWPAKRYPILWAVERQMLIDRLCTVDSHDACCPICFARSTYIPPETVHNGVGLVPVESDAWECPTHGHWDYGGRSAALRVQFPND